MKKILALCLTCLLVQVAVEARDYAKLHIKEKQYIHIELSIDGKTADNVIGLIVNTSENKKDNSYVLHIVFVNINKRTRNKIFSRVYEYIS